MREILFRGKRCDNGEWVQGYYIRADHHWHNHGIHKDWIICGASANGGWFALHNKYAVKAETVGQYTGLTDKNGKRIFEGDMVKPFDDEIDKMVVESHHGQFLLCLYGERGYMAEYGWEEEGNYGCFEAEPLSSYGDDIEVIGNIYENMGLLNGGDEK